MYIWLIERKNGEWGYDEASGFVVVAKTEEEARKLTQGKWGDYKYNADEVEAKAIGRASKLYSEPTVILRDFNAR